MTSMQNLVLIIVGAVLVGANLAVVAPLATNAVQGVVDDETVLDEDDWTDEDWLVSTASRTYSGWNLTNAAALLADPQTAPVWEEVGPFEYEITTTRTDVVHDEGGYTLSYNETSTYEWTGGGAPDTMLTNLNILYEPQRIAVFPQYVEGVLATLGVGFAAGMLENDLNNTAPTLMTVDDLNAGRAFAGGDVNYTTGAYLQWNATMGAAYVATLNGSSPTVDTWPEPAFNSSISYAFENAVDPSGEANISLTSRWGPVFFAGMGAPEMNISAILADPANSTTMQRATLYGYADPSPMVTFSRDWALYAAVGTAFQSHGGGSDWTLDAGNYSTRLNTVSGSNLSAAATANLLFNGSNTTAPLGLLATNPDGTAFGLATFLQMEASAAMATYNLSLADYGAVATWAGAWASGAMGFPLILKGGSGLMNASEFALVAFGGTNPLDGGVVTPGLNLGGLWELGGGARVELNATQIDTVLNGPMGLATSGSLLALWGHTSGMTVPVNPATMAPTPGGTQLPWNASLISAIYGVDANAAAAISQWIGVMFDVQVPAYMASTFGVERFATHELQQWLFGWHDPLLAFSATGNPADLSVGWVSLETNETYFGSGGIETGATRYTINTGEDDLTKVGELVAIDGSNELYWHSTAVNMATLGLIDVETIDGATGGWVDGTDVDDDATFTLRLGQYAVIPAVPAGEGEVKDIETLSYTASLDPATRPIQAKLANTGTLMDAFPSAIPVYFGAEAELEAEEVTGRIISGNVVATFSIHLEGLGHTDPPTAAQLHPVFRTHDASSLDDDAAETITQDVHGNQAFMTYWTNFDSWIDGVTLLVYVGALVCIGLGVRGLVRKGDGDAAPAEFE